jgi:transcriptional regulator with XRE-family HTH domain
MARKSEKPRRSRLKPARIRRVWGIEPAVASAKRPGIGQALRMLRLHLRWSQNDLSARTGLRRIEISAIESGRNLGSSWRVRTLLAQGLGVKKETLDPYLDGEAALDEIATKLRPADADKKKPSAGRAASASTKAAGASSLFAKFPNLNEAVRIVARDSNVEESVVREAASRIARTASEDKKILQWASLLDEAIGRLGSGTRINPLRIPNLASAIRLLAQEDPQQEPHLKALAARLVAAHENPLVPQTMYWIRALDRELAHGDGGLAHGEKAAAPKRSGKR